MLIFKTFYKFMISGLPLFIYNGFKQNTLYAPFYVDPLSTYINVHVTEEQKKQIESVLKTDFDFQKIKFTENDKHPNDYLISANIYNCTSPIFDMISKNVARCEFNAYVKKFNKLGTLIVDYSSDAIISLDPVKLLHKPIETIFKKENNNIICETYTRHFHIFLNYTVSENDKKTKMSQELVDHTEHIFYPNGIYDEIYYNNHFLNSPLHEPVVNNVSVSFFNITFDNVDVFYYKNPLSFILGLWHNANKYIDE